MRSLPTLCLASLLLVACNNDIDQVGAIRVTSSALSTAKQMTAGLQSQMAAGEKVMALNFENSAGGEANVSASYRPDSVGEGGWLHVTIKYDGYYDPAQQMILDGTLTADYSVKRFAPADMRVRYTGGLDVKGTLNGHAELAIDATVVGERTSLCGNVDGFQVGDVCDR